MIERNRGHSGETGMVYDVLGGTSLGMFLGILVGMSTTPVVSIVITALVALLGALFGLSDKASFSTSTAGARRLIAFALSATLCTLIGIALRTHETLAPSVDHQKEVLRSIGYADTTKEQTEMLRYLRYGLLPAGTTVTKERQSSIPVLFSNSPPSFCGDLSRTRSLADTLQILAGADSRQQRIADKIKSLPVEKQGDAAELAKSILCPDN